ncbi:hypothetical protein P4475_14970 [Halalkalibacterium halodurans]|uniref:hypothetical protein n=1 Tax=Halalkalibacterium halodurans TaxID=86665 RepID=UPI002E1B0562|nr:hypothetical protein [Halalkalibacterium halodurans]
MAGNIEQKKIFNWMRAIGIFVVFILAIATLITDNDLWIGLSGFIVGIFVIIIGIEHIKSKRVGSILAMLVGVLCIVVTLLRLTIEFTLF